MGLYSEAFTVPEQNIPVLSKSILLYSHNSYSNHISHATLHEVDTDGSEQMLSEGVPLTQDEVKELLTSMTDTEQEDGLIPQEVLSQSATHLMWYVKGIKQLMWFNIGGNSFSLKVPYPNLIFLVSHGQLYLTSYKGNRVPNENTKLTHSPLWNVYSKTSVCTGSADLPVGYSYASINQWTQVITQTFFSHTNHEKTLKKGKNDLKFWKSMQTKNKFPPELLNPLKVQSGQQINLSQWLNLIRKK